MIFVAVFETAIGALLVPIFDQFMPNTGAKSETLVRFAKIYSATIGFARG
jgi:hypothetical protein